MPRYHGRIVCAVGVLIGLLATPACAQVAGVVPCPPVAGLAPHPDTTNALGLLPYLARAVAMNGLCDELVPAPFAWNLTLDGKPCYTGGPPTAASSYRDSLMCLGLCGYPFCPANFAADVALLVRLRATLVQFAASSWEQPEKFTPGSDFLRAAAETVRRINEAFDCAGLPRPYIQASVLENLGANITCGPPDNPCQPWMRPGPLGTNSGVNTVLIPTSVITEFRTEIQGDSASTHYLTKAGAPRDSLHFNFFRIASPFMDGYSPDITLLEGRLWFFYQAKCFLDAGYTSLHMGQPKVWGKLYATTDATRPAALHAVAVLMARIRRYAQTRPGLSNARLLLTAEPMSEPERNSNSLKFEDGPGRLIFDLNLATMRPREISPALDEQAGTQRSSTYRCPAIDVAALSTRACTGQYLAAIDPCHGFNFASNGGGRTPLGFSYPQQLPYIVYFDHGGTINRLPTGELVPTKVLWPGNNGTWGWDDAGWFSAALNDSCQADWLRVEFAQVRTLTARGSFLAAPGRLTNNLQVGLYNGAGKAPRPEVGVPDYRLAGHPLVAQAVAAVWEPRIPVPTLTATTGAGLLWKPCSQSTFFRRVAGYLPAWQLAVAQPDVTSIYSWHIEGPRGPEPPLFGPQAAFYPSLPGTYTVVLQQDNLGLPAATGGTRRFSLPTEPPIDTQCLSARAAHKLRRAAGLPGCRPGQ